MLLNGIIYLIQWNTEVNYDTFITPIVEISDISRKSITRGD